MHQNNSPYFNLTCSRGHTSQFDKREVCRRNRIAWRETGQDSNKMDELLLKCKECGEEMSYEVDCKGYRYL